MKENEDSKLRTLFYKLFYANSPYKTPPQTNDPEERLLVDSRLLLEAKEYQKILALTEQQNKPEFLTLRGLVYHKLKDYTQAEEQLKKAINADPAFGLPDYVSGNLYKEQKRYEEAEQAYKSALEKDEDNIAIYNGLGNLYAILKRYEEAEQAYQTAIDEDESFYVGHNGLGNIYYALKRYEDAEHAYKSAIKKNKYYALPYNGLGNVYYEQKRYQEAEQAYKAAIIKDENESAPYNGLGNLYSELKRYNEAERHYKLSLDKDPDNIGTIRNLALLYTRTNVRPDSRFLEFYKKIALLNGNLTDAYILALISGNNAEAIKEVTDKKEIDTKLHETRQITTSGFVIFIDLCNSTEFKMQFKEEWFERLIHFYTATEKHLMDKLAAFKHQVHLLKYIGDEVMFFIEEKSNGDHCKNFELLGDIIYFIETIRDHLNRIYFLTIKPSNSEESPISKMIAYESQPDKIDIKTCVTYVNEVNKYTFNQEKNFDILGAPVDFSARLMGLCKENMVICNHDFAQMFSGTNHQKKFKNIGNFKMKGIDEKYPSNTDVYIYDHNNLSSIINQNYLIKHSTINDEIIGRFLLSDRFRNQ